MLVANLNFLMDHSHLTLPLPTLSLLLCYSFRPTILNRRSPGTGSLFAPVALNWNDYCWTHFAIVRQSEVAGCRFYWIESSGYPELVMHWRSNRSYWLKWTNPRRMVEALESMNYRFYHPESLSRHLFAPSRARSLHHHRLRCPKIDVWHVIYAMAKQNYH